MTKNLQTMANKTYKKRAGTSGIQGQLYETKLISLIYFRLTHDDSVEQFSLATNRDDIGAFDDICLKVKVKGFDKPLVVFIQAKHRENDKKIIFTSKTDLAKYFDSYLEIRRAFKPSSNDTIFGRKFDETECFFVIYTTAKDDPNNKIYDGSFADYLNELIGTGSCSTQPSYKDEDLDFLCKIIMKEQITTLSEQLAKFICDEPEGELTMNNDIMLRYHVILALNVLDVSKIQPEGHRIANIRQDFFASNEEFIMLIKNILCLEVLKKRKSEETDDQSLLLKFLSNSSEVKTLSKLIGSVLKYKNNKLEFVSKSMTDDLKRQLDETNVAQSTVYEAAELAAKEYLLSLKFKVPSFFGNKDLAIRGKREKINKRLNHLTEKIKNIIKQSKPNHIVTIDESLEDGFLQLNGGIASAVGNILVFDETSKLLKFTDNCESLGNLAKTWYEILTSQIENLHEYKFDVKVKKFPKLSFERGEYDRSLVRDFYNKLLFYTTQADQNLVEETLIKEIEYYPCSDFNHFRDRSKLIFLKYHDDIQKLWMKPDVGSYLTRKSKIYENAVTYAMSEPLIGVINKMRKIKNQDYTFNENALKRFQLHGEILGTVIASENCVLTVAKVEQCLRNKEHVVLDLEYIFTLTLKSHNILCKELTNTTKEKIFIIVFKKIQDSENSCNRLESIAKAVDGKQIIIITNKISVDIMVKYFSQTSHVLNDDRMIFTDLSVESQKELLARSKVQFQGEDLCLSIIVDDESAKLIEEDVLKQLINNETIVIGTTVINSNYDKAKPFYINRRVSRTKQRQDDKFDEVKDKVLETFYDLEDNVVLITAMPGMGKSTLLTHLSIKTKEVDPKVWIVRVNLLEHARILSKWQDNKTVINVIDSLNLICQVALDQKYSEFDEEDEVYIELEESPNGIVSFKKCSGDNSKVFQLKMFLHFYNRGKLILLFDGFDEIFPHYEREALSLLKSVRSYPRQHKVWITSRSFNLIKSVLEQEFGRSYEIEHFSQVEQDTYFNTFWKTKIQFKNLNEKQLQNVHDFVYFMLELLPTEEFRISSALRRNPYNVVYLNFFDFLKTESIATDTIDISNDAYQLNLSHGIDFSYDAFKSDLSAFYKGQRVFSNLTNDLTAPPLHLYLLAECFRKNIEDVGERNHKWDVDVTGYIFYEYYYETKIKKIRFQEKNKIDIFNPDNKMAYEKERADSVAKHKKLGAYAIFYPFVKIFEEAVLKEIKDMIDELSDGREKTGLIRTVADGIPLFVHMSFAEYFAVEYICDLLRTENNKEKQERLWDFIVNIMFLVCGRSFFILFNTKIKIDEKLRSVVENNKRVIFRMLYKQQKCTMRSLWTHYEIVDNINSGMKFEEYHRHVLLITSMCKDLFHRNVLHENSAVNFNDLIHFYYLISDEDLHSPPRHMHLNLPDETVICSCNAVHF